MAGPISVDLRERVIAAYERGEETQEEIAERFGIGVASVVRWVALKRNKGTLEPGRATGRPRRFGKAEEKALVAALEADNSLTLLELAEAVYEQTGSSFVVETVRRHLIRLGWTRKKNAAGR